MKIKILFLFLLTSVLCAQTINVDSSEAHYNKAILYYLQKNFTSFVNESKIAESYRPNSPKYLYAIAAGNAILGNKKETLDALERLVTLKIYMEVDRDSSFVTFWKDEDFKYAVKKMKLTMGMKLGSEPVFTLKEKDLVTEGVAYSPLTKKYYISSVYKRKIVEVDLKGKAKDFVAEGADSLWSVFGLKVDDKRKHLWVCTGAIEQTKNVDTNDIGKSSLFVYDLKTGKRIKRFDLSNFAQPHLLGDLIIGSNGDVYASDSRTNMIYYIPANGNDFEEFYTSKDFKSLQGIAFDAKEKNIFAADYSTGVHKIDMTTKQKTILTYPADLSVTGIDGLYFYKNSLIAIQNGIFPHRVIRMKLNAEHTSIVSWEILELNNPQFNEPTLGTIIKDDFYFVANSQWGNFTLDGKILPAEKFEEPLILKIKLK